MSLPAEFSAKAGSGLRSGVRALGGALLIAAIFLTSDTLIDQIWRIQGDFRSIFISFSYLLLPIAISLSTIVLVLRCRDEKAISRIALALVTVSLLSRLIWISAYDSYQVNDFGYYLQCGADVARNGTPMNSPFCEGPYWKRSAFYTYPLVRIFGQSLLAIKLANVLLAALASWIFFQTCKINFGARTAAIALVFFIWQPDVWYSVTLASHDVPGLFWLGVFYYFCALLHRRLQSTPTCWPALVGLSLCLGGTIFFLDFSRSYQHGAILALVLYAAVHTVLIVRAAQNGREGAAASSESLFPRGASTRAALKTALTHAALLLLLPFGVYRLANASFWSVWHVQPGQGETGLTCYLSVMDVLGTSDYEEINNWYDRECPLIRGREKTIFAIRKVLHDVTHDRLEFLLHVERKNRVLGRSDDYIEWATYTQYEPWDTTHNQVKRINRSNLDEQNQMVCLAESIVLALVLWRLLLFPRLPFRLAELIPISFSWLYFLMFLVLVESQPRYDIFLIFPFSWMAAQAVEDLRQRGKGHSMPVPAHTPTPRARFYLGGALVLASLVGAYWGAAALIADSSLTLRDQSGFARVPPDQVVAEARHYREVAPVFIRNNHKQVMIAYPPGVALEAGSIIAVQRTFTVQEGKNHHLRFFISNYSVREEPFDRQITWEDTNLEYLIAVNGKTIARGNVNDIRDNRYFSLYPGNGIDFAPRMTIQLIVRNDAKIGIVEPDRGPIMSLEYVDLQ